MTASCAAASATPPPACPTPFWAPTARASLRSRIFRMESAVSAHRARRFPLRWRRSDARVSDQATISQAAAHDFTQRRDKAASVVGAPAVVAERLFLDGAVQMERLDVDCGARGGAAEQATRGLRAVGVAVPE